MYQRFAFHLSLCLRAAALADAPFAIFNDSVFTGGCPVCEPCDFHTVYERDAINSVGNISKRGIQYCNPVGTDMSLHSVSWRVNVSALDQTELIQDSVKWIAGEKSSIELSKDKSFHGAQQSTILAKNMKKRGARKSLERLGKDVLKDILENNIQLRIDENKNFYVRLKLSELVKGEICLAERNSVSSTVKGIFKIESYPGDSTLEVITNLIEDIINLE